MSEFFDGDMARTRAFIELTWMPEARRTLGMLASSIGFQDAKRSAFLCDHLREGARTVGEPVIMDLASSIENHVRGRRFEQASELVWDGVIHLRRAHANLARVR